MKTKKIRDFIVIELYNKGAATGIIPDFTFIALIFKTMQK